MAGRIPLYRCVSILLGVVASALLLGTASSARAQGTCEVDCNHECNQLPRGERRICKLQCFAGRCANPGALRSAQARSEEGIDCEVDGICNEFCAEGPSEDLDCEEPAEEGFCPCFDRAGLNQVFTDPASSDCLDFRPFAFDVSLGDDSGNMVRTWLGAQLICTCSTSPSVCSAGALAITSEEFNACVAAIENSDVGQLLCGAD